MVLATLISLIIPCVMEEPLAITSLSITSLSITKASAVLTIKNKGNRTLKIWSPSNFEGMDSIAFLFECGDQKGRWKPPVPPRAGGVATAVELEPGKSLRLLPVDLSPLIAKVNHLKSSLLITPQYSNSLSKRPPVTGVWTGSIRGAARSVRL